MYILTSVLEVSSTLFNPAAPPPLQPLRNSANSTNWSATTGFIVYPSDCGFAPTREKPSRGRAIARELSSPNKKLDELRTKATSFQETNPRTVSSSRPLHRRRTSSNLIISRDRLPINCRLVCVITEVGTRTTCADLSCRQVKQIKSCRLVELNNFGLNFKL